MGRKKNRLNEEHHLNLDSPNPRTIRYNVMRLEEALGIEIPKWTFGKTMAGKLSDKTK